MNKREKIKLQKEHEDKLNKKIFFNENYFYNIVDNLDKHKDYICFVNSFYHEDVARFSFEEPLYIRRSINKNKE